MISKAHIKQLRALQQKKFREEQNRFVIEGFKLLTEAIQYDQELIETVYTTKPQDLNKYPSLNVQEISTKELSQISSLRSPQPFFTVCKKPESQLINCKLEIVLDTIQDPGNLGTILRLAAWFGIEQVVLSENCVDLFNPKVIQASMGAIFTVNTVEVQIEKYLSKSEKPVFGAVMNGVNVYEQKLPESGILLMGNEGNGIHAALEKYISTPLSIPKFGAGESLNVAMATGILLSEFKRG